MRSGALCAARAVIVACLIVGLGACSNNRDDASDSGTQTPLAPTGEQGVGPRAALSTEDGSAVAGVEFVAVTDLIGVPVGFNSGASPLEVHVPEGTVSAPVSLAIPGTPPPSGAYPIMLHRNDSGAWESVPASYEDGRYVAEVMSFSWYWPGWADSASDWVTSTSGQVVDAVGNVVDSGFDWATGRTDQPEPCGTDPYPWVATTGSPPDGAFHICLDRNPDEAGNERVEVKIKSNRAVAMWVVVPRHNADYLWVEGSTWDTIGPILAAFTGGGTERVLLGPGRTLTVGFRQPIGVGITQEFFAYQDTVTQVFSLLNRHVGEVQAELGTVLATIACFDTDKTAPAVVAWDRMSSCASSALGMTMSQVEAAFEAAVSSGRLALGNSDAEAFRAAVLGTERSSSTLAGLKQASSILTWSRIAADGVVLLNDAIASGATGAGKVTINLLSGPAQDDQGPTTATPPTTAAPESDTQSDTGDGSSTGGVSFFECARFDSISGLGGGPTSCFSLGDLYVSNAYIDEIGMQIVCYPRTEAALGLRAAPRPPIMYSDVTSWVATTYFDPGGSPRWHYCYLQLSGSRWNGSEVDEIRSLVEAFVEDIDSMTCEEMGLHGCIDS